MRTYWIGCLCLAATASTFADDQYDLTGMIRPGLWEVETQRVTPDGQAGPVETDRDCVTLEDIRDFGSFAQGDQSQNVTIEEFERGDDYVRYRMGFAGDDPQVEVQGSMSGDMKFDGPERYSGTMGFTMNFQGQSMETLTKIDARRIGDCEEPTE